MLGRACRWTLAIVFLLAAVTKIIDLPGFTDRLVLHSGLPFLAARAVASFLPWLELTCGFCLALNRAAREAAVICCGLLVLFLMHAFIHPTESDCGCFVFPRSWQPVSPWPWLIVRDSILLLTGLRVAWRPARRPEQAGLQSHQPAQAVFDTGQSGRADYAPRTDQAPLVNRPDRITKNGAG